MHTTEYTFKNRPRLWVIHNHDFVGGVYVHWQEGQSPIQVWTVSFGRELLTGDFVFSPVTYLHDGKITPVPAWVIGRSVTTAVQFALTSKIVNFVENLDITNADV